MISFRLTALAGVPVMAAFLVMTACGGGTNPGSNAPVAGGQSHVVTINYKVVGSGDDLAKVGVDGQKHDTFWTEDSTTVHVGDKVTIKILNYDDVPHSMDFPDLGISQEIVGGQDGQPSETTFTFTATKTGTFRWDCEIPCDSDQDQWAMKDSSTGPGVDDFMAGYVTVTA